MSSLLIAPISLQLLVERHTDWVQVVNNAVSSKYEKLLVIDEESAEVEVVLKRTLMSLQVLLAKKPGCPDVTVMCIF